MSINHALAQQSYIEIGERPWGRYFVLDVQDGYKVKRIEVEPGQRLSLQSHEYRSEHWIVSRGIATVELQIPDRSEPIVTETLHVGQNAFIPSGYLHRLSNTSDSLLVIVEVQIGTHTGEDDIIRYEDDYSRL